MCGCVCAIPFVCVCVCAAENVWSVVETEPNGRNGMFDSEMPECVNMFVAVVDMVRSGRTVLGYSRMVSSDFKLGSASRVI